MPRIMNIHEPMEIVITPDTTHILTSSCASSKLKEVHCVGAGLVPARTAGGCGPQRGHKGRPYEGELQTFNLVDALH